MRHVYIQPGGFYPDMISCLAAAAKPCAVSQGAIRHRWPVSQAELQLGTLAFFFFFLPYAVFFSFDRCEQKILCLSTPAL